MINFLEETIDFLESHDKKPEDVLWVGDSEKFFTWEDFSKIADFEYNNGFGRAEIIDDLLVTGDNWWLERHEYDGAEEWEFKTYPIKPAFYKVPEKIHGLLT